MRGNHSILVLGICIACVFSLVIVLIPLAPAASATQTPAKLEPARANEAGRFRVSAPLLSPSAAAALYLPIVLNASSSGPLPSPTSTPGTPTPNPTSTPEPPLPSPTNTPEPQPGTSGGLFLNKTNWTDSPKVAIDGSGGIHMAYNAYGADGTGKTPAYYAYCDANCGSSSSWGIASFGDKVDQVELALTKSGHPRMLLYSHDASFDRLFQYAACDAACTNSSNWRIANAATSTYVDAFLWDYSHFSFALDNLDRPRFVYRKYQGGAAAYAFCDAPDCTQPGAWFETELAPTSYYFSHPSLVFTTDGKPRMAVGIAYPGQSSDLLFYVTCDSACDQAGNWLYLPLYDGGGAEFVLRLDSQNRPRLALYQGAPASGTAGFLFYAACDTACTNSANWQSTDINLPANSARAPDLAFDAQGRPRIAYHDEANDVLGYAWCSVNCATENAGWQQTTAEANSALTAEFDPPIPISCSTGYWYSGDHPSLALNSSGNPRIGHKATHLYGGTCVTDWDWYAVRLTYFNQP